MKRTWKIDNAHSQIDFAVRHMVVAKVRGRFNAWAGELDLDEKDLTRSSVKVEIDAASIDTGNGQRDGHLRSPDFFDAEKFPKLSFRSKRIEKGGPGRDRYRVVGDLTIRDVTREVVLDAEALGIGKDPWGNDRAAFSASASIDRREFGLTWNQVLEAGGVLVGEKIEIGIELQAVTQAAAAKSAA
jgi:polyisoprenoid-binding protein YceI